MSANKDILYFCHNGGDVQIDNIKKLKLIKGVGNGTGRCAGCAYVAPGNHNIEIYVNEEAGIHEVNNCDGWPKIGNSIKKRFAGFSIQTMIDSCNPDLIDD